MHQDHPDIEKLPLVINNIPVRETIRDIFRNPENGTPDNINKAGCLALAKQGAIIWNAWRAAFPAIQILKAIFPTQYRNRADFSSQNFQGILSNLQDFDFGNRANFDQSVWGSFTKFEGTKWGNQSSFFGAVWGDHCNFERAQWGEFCRFDGAVWGETTKFSSAKWGSNCMFNEARWGVHSSFAHANLGGWLKFNNCVFEHDAAFDFSCFGKDIKFTGTIFEGSVRFSSSDNANKFSSIDFSGCEFKKEADFGGRKFCGKTNFGLTHESDKKLSLVRDEKGLIVYRDDNEFPLFYKTDFDRRPVIFHKQPNFHGCEIHQDTSFEGAKFPEPTGTEEAARACRTLKLAFSKQQAVREEQRFFRLEMAEETMGYRNKAKQALREFELLKGLREGFTWVLYKAYSMLSDYGFSVARPLVLLVAAWLVFAAIYGSHSNGQTICMVWMEGCELQINWLNFSLQQALPLPGFDKLDHPIKGVAVGWLFLHKTISLAALFLIGLALRNLFKLK
jgi:hypothetical protein